METTSINEATKLSIVDYYKSSMEAALKTSGPYGLYHTAEQTDNGLQHEILYSNPAFIQKYAELLIYVREEMLSNEAERRGFKV